MLKIVTSVFYLRQVLAPDMAWICHYRFEEPI